MADGVEVPNPYGELQPIWHFALSIDGYGTCGHHRPRLQQLRDEWDAGLDFPNDLPRLRCAPFYLQRTVHMWGEDPEGDDERYVRAMVAKIAELSGGRVPGPHWLDASRAAQG